jgi:hypothetical protein
LNKVSHIGLQQALSESAGRKSPEGETMTLAQRTGCVRNDPDQQGSLHTVHGTASFTYLSFAATKRRRVWSGDEVTAWPAVAA